MPSASPCSVLLLEQYGFTSRVVPYDGAAPAITAILGGHADLTAASIAASMASLKSGKLKALYFLGEKRNKLFPDLVTYKEAGVKSYHPFWRTVLAPKATPRPIIDKLGASFKKMLETPSVISLLDKMGEEPVYLGPDEFTKVWLEEFKFYKQYGSN